MTHTLFTQQGGKGVSLDRFRVFLKRLQDGMLKLEFAHYDWQGEAASSAGPLTPHTPRPSVHASHPGA